MRAGLLGTYPTLPELFFPSVTATLKRSQSSSSSSLNSLNGGLNGDLHRLSLNGYNGNTTQHNGNSGSNQSINSCGDDVVARLFGIQSLTPEIRRKAVIAYPLGHKLGTRVSPGDYQYGVYLDCFKDMFEHIFDSLGVMKHLKNYKVLLSIPQNFAPVVKLRILKPLFDDFGVFGVTAVHQNILALYAYDQTTGIVVNIGDRVDI